MQGPNPDPHPNQFIVGHPLEAHLYWLWRQLEIDCLLDVGANRGQYAGQARSLGYRGPIISFEPLPSLVQELEKLASADPHWEIHAQACGDREEQRLINYFPKAPDLSSLRSTSDYFDKEFGDKAKPKKLEKLEITVRRLDSLSFPYKRIFLKTDTQGFDFQALQGAEGILPQVAGIQFEAAEHHLYEEVNSWQEIVSFLIERGFSLAGLYPITLDRHLRAMEYDCLLLKEDRVKPLPGPFQWQHGPGTLKS